MKCNYENCPFVYWGRVGEYFYGLETVKDRFEELSKKCPCRNVIEFPLSETKIECILLSGRRKSE